MPIELNEKFLTIFYLSNKGLKTKLLFALQLKD